MSNSFDEIQIEEDSAFFEWHWRHELAARDAQDVERANRELLAVRLPQSVTEENLDQILAREV